MAKNAVLVIADDIQLPPAVFLASRLAALKGDRDVDIILATDSKDALEKLGTFGGGFTSMDVGDVHAGLQMPSVSYFTRATYYCLFVPPRLAGAYERVLYLDVDVYPESDRLFSLFALDMGRDPIAAVRDLQVGFLANPSNEAEVRATLGADADRSAGAKYLNSGVLLMDLRAYRRAQIEKQALRLIAEQRLYLRYPDQTILNAILRARWLELSPSFNMITRAWASFIRRFALPAIVHFTGPVKPWHRAFIDEHPAKAELAAFLAATPWAGFIADANPPPPATGFLPTPPERQLPRWEGGALQALVRYLRETRFADVEQGITALDFSALPAMS